MMGDMKELRNDSEDLPQIAQQCTIIEEKVDGTRMSFNGAEMRSDRDVLRNARFPHLAEVLLKHNWNIRGEVAIPGSNVLQLNKKINWHKAKFFLFDVFSYKGENMSHLSVKEHRELIEEVLKEVDSPLIETPQLFQTFEEGWDFVKDQEYSEGLVLKFDHVHYKVKLLTEEKIPIVGHEEGKSKGAFIIKRDGVYGKVSASKVENVTLYHEMIARREQPMAEIEYQFLTEAGKPFQPRLRRVFSKKG